MGLLTPFCDFFFLFFGARSKPASLQASSPVLTLESCSATISVWSASCNNFLIYRSRPSSSTSLWSSSRSPFRKVALSLFLLKMRSCRSLTTEWKSTFSRLHLDMTSSAAFCSSVLLSSCSCMFLIVSPASLTQFLAVASSTFSDSFSFSSIS